MADIDRRCSGSTEHVREEITVIIPTQEEAIHVGRCIDSVRRLGRVVVVDSFSTDATRDIARSHGATVVEHAWQGYSAQKNWALENLVQNGGWVLFVDADEYLTSEARAEIRDAVSSRSADAYLVPRVYVFLGRPLRHAWWYPDYQLRLFRVGSGRFESRRVHEHVIADGSVKALRCPLVHENLKGLHAFVERHNRYSDEEALERLYPSPARRRGSFSGSWIDRRRALKQRVWYRTPFRPFVRFLWLYVVRRGFLDGKQGLLFCRLISMYEFLIDAKVTELKLTSAARVRSSEPEVVNS